MISIVMPIYNGEKYLDRAIASIQTQTFLDWELVIVDDGSRDSSPLMLDEYAAKDSRIRVIHKQNGGVSNARQDGMNAARGEYIIQFDCDDWAEPDYLESLYVKAKETDADMVWCNAYGEKPEGSFEWSQEAPEDINEMIKLFLSVDAWGTTKIWGTTWNRLFKASVCHSPNVSFPKGCVCWEDLAFVISALTVCKSIAYCDRYLYHYNLTNAGSITHAFNPKILEDGHILAINHIEDSLKRSYLLDKYLTELRLMKLTTLRDYIDSYAIQDFNKFVNTYPDAIAHINDYPEYPRRLKLCAWLILHNCKFVVPIILKYYALLRKMGLSDLTK